MVLQRAPQRAIVWGFGDPSTLTTLRMNDKVYTTIIVNRNQQMKKVKVFG
jgi:hypothetical protein